MFEAGRSERTQIGITLVQNDDNLVTVKLFVGQIQQVDQVFAQIDALERTLGVHHASLLGLVKNEGPGAVVTGGDRDSVGNGGGSGQNLIQEGAREVAVSVVAGSGAQSRAGERALGVLVSGEQAVGGELAEAADAAGAAGAGAGGATVAMERRGEAGEAVVDVVFVVGSGGGGELIGGRGGRRFRVDGGARRKLKNVGKAWWWYRYRRSWWEGPASRVSHTRVRTFGNGLLQRHL